MTEDELKQKVKQIIIDIDKQYSWQDVDILLTYIDLLEFRQFRYERALGIKEAAWTLTPDEHDKLASNAHYAYEKTNHPDTIQPWGSLNIERKRAWMNAVSFLLMTLDKWEKTTQTVVIDYD